MIASSAFSCMGGMEIVLFFLVWFVNTQIDHLIPYVPTLDACDVHASRLATLASMSPLIRPTHIRCNFVD